MQCVFVSFLCAILHSQHKTIYVRFVRCTCAHAAHCCSLFLVLFTSHLFYSFEIDFNITNGTASYLFSVISCIARANHFIRIAHCSDAVCSVFGFFHFTSLRFDCVKSDSVEKNQTEEWTRWEKKLYPGHDQQRMQKHHSHLRSHQMRFDPMKMVRFSSPDLSLHVWKIVSVYERWRIFSGIYDVEMENEK